MFLFINQSNPELLVFGASLLGTVIGAIISVITTIMYTKNNLKIQERINDANAKKESKTFQRNTLNEIQEKLILHYRLLNIAFIHDIKEYKNTGKWANTSFDKELSENLANNFRQLFILVERIENDTLRNEIQENLSEMSKSHLSTERDIAEVLIAKVN